MNRHLRTYRLVFATAIFATAIVLTGIGRADSSEQFELREATIADIQAAYRDGILSPQHLVSMYLARIAALDRSDLPQPLNGGVGNQPLNSFMHVNENALADAGRLDPEDLMHDGPRHHDDHMEDGRQDPDDRMDGDDDGGRPLFGIPVILKDNIATKDMPTTAGSVALGGSRPEKDAFIALGMPTGFSSQLRFQFFQVPGADLAKVGYGFNRYDPRIDPRTTAPFNDGRPVLATGGSSSGPGIAVSANLVTVGVGTETSGSILSPSGQNMDVGIKPTLGLVSRNGIVPITADQDTAGPIARTVTDAARLLGVLAGFDKKDPATRACLTEGNCFRDYTQFLDANALQGAHIAVPMHPYWIQFGLGAARTKLMNDAIAVMQSLGATVETFEIPSQNVLNNYGTCVTAADVAARRATPVGTVPPCSTVLLFGFKRDPNGYLASKEFGPGTSASSATIPVQTVKTLSDVISFNNLHPEVALKYGQAIAEAADMLDTGPGQDLDDYLADRALDLKLTRTCGLDVLYTGVVPAECADVVAIPVGPTGKKFDAALFPANFGANAPARAGFPSVIVPTGFFPNPAAVPPSFGALPSPFGATFSGPAFSEPKLIGFAYAFEQDTHHRVPPQ